MTRDEWLEPAQLAEYKIAGFGGSTMSPALLKLAEDSEVAAVLVLTDGYISYPEAEPPYCRPVGLVPQQRLHGRDLQTALRRGAVPG